MFKRGNKEKREKYRDGSDSSVPFSLNLILPGRKILPGYLIDINMDGTAISFPSEYCPDFAPDERVRLHLMMTESQKAVFIDAIYKGSSTNKDMKQCRFQFVNPGSFLHDLDVSALSYFNRRQAFRVKPVETPLLKVFLSWDGGSTVGSMTNISITGMGLRIEATVAQTFVLSGLMTLSFQLPNHEDTLKLVGKVIHHRPLGEAVIYGIEYDKNKTEDFYRQETAIAAFVLNQQKEMRLKAVDSE